MAQGHSSETSGNIIQRCPQSLYDFTINLLCSGDIAWRESRKARVLMAMNVKEAYPGPELQRARNEELRTLPHTFFKVDTVLTHDVIHDKGHRDVIHVVG